MFASKIKNFTKRTYLIFNNNKFNFASLNLVSSVVSPNISPQDTSKIKLNWELAKIWVNPQNNISHNNSVSSSSSGTTETDVVAKCSKIDFERYLRKIGKVISKEENVYVQDGSYNSKNIRIVSSNKNDVELVSSLLSQNSSSTDFSAHVVLISNHAEVGKSKKFLFFDESRKIVLSNSTNINLIKEKLDLI